MAWIFLLIAIAFNSAGSLLLKQANQLTREGMLSIYFTWPFLFGMAAYGFNMLFYAKALGGLPLSVAYQVLVGVSILSVTVGAYLFFGERLSPWGWLGTALVIAGLILIVAPHAVG